MTAAVRIHRIAAGGDGVGRLADGRAVFVPRTAPGDVVELGNVRLHARFARADLGRVLEPGPGRVAPRCRHYDRDRCGGCQLQHLDDDTQRAARRAIVGDALRRLARLDLPDPPLDPSPTQWGYRGRITLARDRAGRGPGFHPVNRPDEVFPLERCEIAAEPLNALWAELTVAEVSWPRDLDQVALRLTRDGAMHVVLGTRARPAADTVAPLAAAGADVWWRPPRGRARRLAGRAGEEALAFAQVHPVMGDRVREWAVAELGEIGGRHVWDLYAGTGDTTRLLAARGATVESVERNAPAVAHARHTGPAEGVRRHALSVEAAVTELVPSDAVVTNPPRTGMSEPVLAAILAAAPRVIAYVSCDPATLARDLHRLRERYDVARVMAFDLFPQTAHVETVTRLERR